MAYAYDAGLIDRVKPRISQWEATTGRRITPTMLDSLIRGQLEAEAGKAQQSRALDLQERGIANQEEQQKKADKAAKVKGITDLASTAGMGYLTYKAVTKPSEMSELIKYKKGLETDQAYDKILAGSEFGASTAATTPGTMVSSTAPAYTGASVAPSVTSGVSGIEYGSGAAAGAQTALGGGTSAVGAQTALAGGETASLAAYDAAMAEGAAAGVGSTAGTGAAAGTGIFGTVAPPAIGWTVGSLVAQGIDKFSPIGGAKEKSIAGNIAKGAGFGAGIGSVVPVVGTAVGAVIGGIVGGAVGLVEDASVVCSELLRQGRISPAERKACVLYRFRYISDVMFDAYLEWARPHVEAMRKGGWRNAIRLPFAHAFVRYMIAIQDRRVPTLAQRIVWEYAWSRCEKIAQRTEYFVGEVA